MGGEGEVRGLFQEGGVSGRSAVEGQFEGDGGEGGEEEVKDGQHVGVAEQLQGLHCLGGVGGHHPFDGDGTRDCGGALGSSPRPFACLHLHEESAGGAIIASNLA